MCGIAGYVGRFDPALLAQMGRAQGHRGPDASGEWHDARAGLSHVRLSILDLTSAGAQPMADAAGKLILTFNGEIYNYRALRAQLERLAKPLAKSGYGQYLLRLLTEKVF